MDAATLNIASISIQFRRAFLLPVSKPSLPTLMIAVGTALGERPPAQIPASGITALGSCLE